MAQTRGMAVLLVVGVRSCSQGVPGAVQRDAAGTKRRSHESTL
jgi:hypothetical protein